MISRLLEVQERRQPRPFLETSLGKLPPELRVKIYQHLLVTPQFQPFIEVEELPSATKSKIRNGSSLAASQRFIHLKQSNISILQTCHQIKLEAYPIFHANGVPYFTDAREFFQFLKVIGPADRLRLEAFRIGRLCPFTPKEQSVHHVYHTYIMFLYYIKDSVSLRKMDPDIRAGYNLLMECNSLCMIYIDMKAGAEILHFHVLRRFLKRVRTGLRALDIHHWFIQRSGEVLYKEDQEFPPREEVFPELIASGQATGCDVLVKLGMNPLISPKPFLETRLGKLPPILRAQVYHKLVALLQTRDGPGLVAQGHSGKAQDPDVYLTPPTTFIHIQASYLPVLRVCRQIHFEAHPVFYDRNSFYAANTKEFEQLTRLSARLFPRPLLCGTTITALCVKNIVSWSDGKGFHLNSKTLMSVFQLREWKSLRKICLFMLVGEEIGYLEFLFHLPGMSRGVVEFLDDSHWVLRRQPPEDEWQTQYACFETNWQSYRKSKNGMELSDRDIETQRQIMKTDSRVTGLNGGVERFVEVKIGAALEEGMPSAMGALMEAFGRLRLD